MQELKRDPRRQGDQGEMSAVLWLWSMGFPVFLPIGHSRDYDVVTDFGEALLRVQVKTSNCFRNRRWDVALATRGGNQSWSGLVKYLDPARYDYLFVLVGDGRRWFIPAAEVGATSALKLGGPKYGRFEIEAGHALRPSFQR